MTSWKTTVKMCAAAAGIAASSGPGLADSVGTASYYGRDFHGRRSADGDRFNMNALTAAHRSLPFGTRLKVTNLTNGKEVIVRVSDRGPFIRGRVLDLSYGAARQLDFVRSGTARVRFARM